MHEALEGRHTIGRGVSPWTEISTNWEALEGRSTQPEERTMPQSYTCLHYHMTFSTKTRAALIDPALRDPLYAYMVGVLVNHKGRDVTINGPRDHVHIVATLHPEVGVSELLRLVKANSSKWVHETYPERRDFGWQNGYAAFTVSHSNLEQVREYVKCQEEHHRTMTFQEEFIAFLKRHGVPYDERYVFA